MQINSATSEQVDLLVDMWSQFMEEHDEIVLAREPRLAPLEMKNKNMKEAYRAFVTTCLESSECSAFVAEGESRKIIGYVLIVVKDEIPIYERRKCGCISDLYVKPEYRGKGVGTSLVNRGLDWLQRKGITAVSVPLYSVNEQAYEAYRKWGFLDYKLEMRKTI